MYIRAIITKSDDTVIDRIVEADSMAEAKDIAVADFPGWKNCRLVYVPTLTG